MDPFSSFFSVSFLFYALAIYALTFVIRTVVEFVWKGAPLNREWNQLILPLLPLLFGAASGFISKLYPDPLGTSLMAREVFGLCSGLLSGLVYGILKSYVKSQFPTTAVTPAPVSVPDSTTTSASNSVPTMSADLHKNL